MTIFRRRRLPVELRDAQAAFRSVVGEVELAKAALAQAAPTARLAGRPLPDALAEFEEHLGLASQRMEAWRRKEVEEAWGRTRSGLERALRLAERARVEAPDLGGFEGLVGLVGDLLAPLEAFEDAEERFRSLRT